MRELDLNTLAGPNLDLTFTRKLAEEIQQSNLSVARAVEAMRRAEENEKRRRHEELVSAIKEAGEAGATIIIGDNARDIQIQQNSAGAKQKMVVSEGLDYDKVKAILCEIKEYFDMPKFQETFGNNSENIKNMVDTTLEAVSNNEDESLVKKSLRVIRDIAYNAAGSLIATGIIALLNQLPLG